MRLLKLLKNRPPNFAGETIGMEVDATADTLIVEGNAVEVNEQGEVIATKDTLAPVELSLPTTNQEPTGQWKFDARTDPFTTDGISKQASLALHAKGLHTVAAVRQFIAELPEGVDVVTAINEIDGVTDAQAEKIVKLYGMVTEHSEE